MYAHLRAQRGVRPVGVLNLRLPRPGIDTAAKSYDEILHVLTLMGLSGRYPVRMGQRMPLAPGEEAPVSEAADWIIEQALLEAPRPLFYLGQGCLTNLAAALEKRPGIAGRMTATWIGGAPYPHGGWEFNLLNDAHAANVVMDSGIALWQVPMNVFAKMKVSLYTLVDRVWPCGEIGRYLVENLVRVSAEMTTGAPPPELVAGLTLAEQAAAYPSGEGWHLGDTPVVGLLLSDHAGDYDIIGAPRFAPDGRYALRPDNPHRIRVYKDIDAHFMLEDFYAKLHYYYG